MEKNIHKLHKFIHKTVYSNVVYIFKGISRIEEIIFSFFFISIRMEVANWMIISVLSSSIFLRIVATAVPIHNNDELNISFMEFIKWFSFHWRNRSNRPKYPVQNVYHSSQHLFRNMYLCVYISNYISYDFICIIDILFVHVWVKIKFITHLLFHLNFDIILFESYGYLK